jgi:hypothetical protein
MSRFLDEPSTDPIRGYFSQLCVIMSGIATGVVEAAAGETLCSPSYHMGRRDGFHVVVAHLASSSTLREAADKCLAFGMGVLDRAHAHPYGPDWSNGFGRATTEASADIAMYAASGTVPPIDATRLRAARTAARLLSPLAGVWANRPAPSTEPPPRSRDW